MTISGYFALLLRVRREFDQGLQEGQHAGTGIAMFQMAVGNDLCDDRADHCRLEKVQRTALEQSRGQTIEVVDQIGILLKGFGVVENGEGLRRQMFADENDRGFEVGVVAELVDDDRNQVEKARVRNVVVTGNDQMNDRLAEDFRVRGHRANDETNRARPTLAQLRRRSATNDDHVEQRQQLNTLLSSLRCSGKTIFLTCSTIG